MCEIKNGTFILKGEPFFIYSGEMHYFRIPKNKWRIHLLKAKKAGLNTISSYIPWCIHEKEEGKFDFADLLSFLKLLKEMNFYFIARVGPISNAEMTFEGLPDWLLKNYPEVYVKGKELITLPHATLVSYHNPTYLKFVERWYSKLIPIIDEYQIQKNGTIILVQLCNEVGMIQWLNRAADYSEQTEKMYRDFLKGKYGSIEKLNSFYKTNYKSFDEIKQPNNEVEENKYIVYCDWIYFYCDYYAKYYEKLFNFAKKHGVNVPVIANIPQFYDFDVRGRGVYSPMTTLMFRDFSKYVPDVIFGGAYQMRRLDYENFHDVSITTEVVKMVTKPGIPDICCELQFGKLSDRPKIYPSDVELNLVTSTASGLQGLNGYMFSGGRNTEGTGGMGTYHEWQSPVSSDGKERPHFVSVQKFGRFVKIFGDKLAQTKKHNDTAIGFYPPYYATELLEGDFIEKLEEKRTFLFFDGLARLIELAGFSYNIIDLERISLEDLKNIKTLWVFSLDFMDRETQKKLFEYVKSGGNLFLGPRIPYKNLIFENEKFFADALNIKIEDELDEKLVYSDAEEIFVYDKIQIFSGLSEKETLFKTKNGKPCGFIKNVGKGKILVLGSGLNHTFDYHINLVRKIAEKLGITPYVQVDPLFDVPAFLRKKEDFGFLFLANYQELDKFVSVKLILPKEKKPTKIPEKGKIFLKQRSSLILPLNIPLNNEVIMRYSTAEIIDYKAKKNIELDLQTNNLSTNEISFFVRKKPKFVKVNNKNCKFSYKNNIIKIVLPQINKLQKMVLQM